VARVVQRSTPELDWPDAHIHLAIIQNNAYSATNIFSGQRFTILNPAKSELQRYSSFGSMGIVFDARNIPLICA
jgi:hypothetical protein